ncbi:MAG: glycoside hydrolase family 92 protein [Bacteroidales bacterium]|nr:glycoside hydrolase family 92 protein [Bacteroidales bacterium]
MWHVKYLIGVILFFLVGCRQHEAERLLSYIDTRVGTAASTMPTAGRFGKGSEEYGQTIPAVLEPHGMNFWTPQTVDTELKCRAPYYYRDSLLQGFRNSHWIVGGCTQDYGSMTLFPATNVRRCLPASRATRFSHDTEVATPAYYAVHLTDMGIHAELTARSRSAIFRFSYPTDSAAYLIVNPNSDEGEGYIELDTVRKEIRGYNPVHRIYQGKGQSAGYSGYFVVRYEGELDDFGTYHYDTLFAGRTAIGNSHGIGLYVRFVRPNPEKPVVLKAASSFVNMEGACRNMEAEIPHWDFGRTHRELAEIWERELSCVVVDTDEEMAKRKFYGALYRASFLPHTINDVDGCHPSFAGNGEVCVSANYYDDFSLWDTYRALHPLLTLLHPTRSGQMMQSLVDKYRQGGWLPIFPCWNSYTAAMIGDHATAAICDAYIKGVRNFDISTAYAAMRKNAFESPSTYAEYANGMGRRALHSYLAYGYVPVEDSVREAYHKCEQVSRTLEYAYDDYALAQVARLLGRDDDYRELMHRSRNYRHVIDPASGYANGRHADGRFLRGSNPYGFASYITEGASCHYTWYVPHDPVGLMEVMGGREVFVSKLDTLFAERLYWHGNEPCHQVPYMYCFAGQSWKTQRIVRHILDTEYADKPGGLAGNDDAGQMSAWYVFSALGFYPVCPGTPYYVIGTPTFERATLRLEHGHTFTIEAPGTNSQRCYIQSATLNGEPYVLPYLHHDDLMRGGTLHLVMTDTPCVGYGSP